MRADQAIMEAMRLRCEETEHDWENACSAFFQVYQVCKWCGETRDAYGGRR